MARREASLARIGATLDTPTRWRPYIHPILIWIAGGLPWATIPRAIRRLRPLSVLVL